MKKKNVLSLTNISVHYGGVKALDDVSIQINDGEIVALMGPNGAGKSTILKAMFGLASLYYGKLHLDGKLIHPKPYEMVVKGIAYVPQGRQVFKGLTVLENLELGGYAFNNKRDIAVNIEKVVDFFPALRTKLNINAEYLSGGQQQMLTIARALISNPRVLLLDEPSLGLSPKVVKEVFDKVKEINKIQKISVVIVEHSIASVLAIADRAYVLNQGKVVLEDSARKLIGNNKIEQVFLSSIKQ
ncbi:MAG: ABC transporter ATP-binding protein [bacterium]